MDGRRSAREEIWTTASRLFVERGYGPTSVREIARRAEVDPALVLHYFGSKEGLFLDTMRAALDDQPVFAGPLDGFGERFVRELLASDERLKSIQLALLRASDARGVHNRLGEMHETLFVAPLLGRLAGEDAELRARLAGAVVGGLLYALWVVGDERLAAADPERIVARYAPLLQQLVDGH